MISTANLIILSAHQLTRKLSSAFLKAVIHYQLMPRLVLPNSSDTTRDLPTQLRTLGMSYDRSDHTSSAQGKPYITTKQLVQPQLRSRPMNQLRMLYPAYDNKNSPRYSQLTSTKLRTACGMHRITTHSNMPDHALAILRLLNRSLQAEENNQLLVAKAETINSTGTTTQPTITRQCGIQAQRLSWPSHQNRIGPFRHDDSAGRSQRILQQQGSNNQLKFTTLAAPRQHISSYYKLKSVKNHLPKAVKEQKNYWSTIAKTLKHYSNFVFLNSATPASKLVSIESLREDELCED
ncbi:hypothetical protein F511_33530 [Dorcoceras hygrometricum]|uniref:Uncharacterized protein n=1 Tax=Dorcoceras hygrometricum TaxID=472368 RepID=A0A2Z7B4N3_9LAMI|nr:hypothetical protein F511_33530 [Dorcoceras hygrometricum]